MDETDGLYLCAAIGVMALCLLLHGKVLRALVDNQVQMQEDVEFVKTYLKETEALGNE